MAECNSNCATCSTSCKSGCPLCNVKGKTVPLITVKSLVKNGADYLNDNQAYICINRKCNVIYFQEENLFMQMSRFFLVLFIFLIFIIHYSLF